MQTALLFAVVAGLWRQAAGFTYEYDWRLLDYDQFTSTRPRSLHGTMSGTNSTRSYNCKHFDCLARNSNQQLYSQSVDESWSRRCLFGFNDTYYLQPCNNETNRCVYIEGMSSGICVDFFEINNITSLMPGDSCPVEWYDRKRQKCQWGTFKCIDGVCQGIPIGETCARQEDCVPGAYCHDNSTCVTEKKIGDECLGDHECPRNSSCAMNSDQTASICTAYFSLKVGDSASANFAGSTVVAHEWTEMLCESGAMHPMTGKCIAAPKSSNLGKTCESDTECTTSESGVFGKCQCYMGKAKTKRCGPMRGDPEGQAEFKAFQSYIKTTQKYRREHEVNPDDEASWSSYSSYRCKRVEYRAKLALESLGDLDCIKLEQEDYRQLIKDLPFFTEYTMYCWQALCRVSLIFVLSILFWLS